MSRRDVFDSQADAVKAVREFWGFTRNMQGQSFAALKADERFDTPLGYFAAYVTARVNKHDVLIEFDTFGRKQRVTVLKGA